MDRRNARAALDSKSLQADVLKAEATLAKLKQQKNQLRAVTIQSSAAADIPGGQLTHWASSQGKLQSKNTRELVEEAKHNPRAEALIGSVLRGPGAASAMAGVVPGMAAGSGLAAIAAARRQAAAGYPDSQGGASKRALRPSAAASWGFGEVSDWLALLGLDQYSELMGTHAVAGVELLELTAKDLDYIGVTPLGHRKLLLKGVDQLRAACGMGAAAASTMGEAQAAQGEGRMGPGRGGNKVHWTQAAPLPGASVLSSSSSSAGTGSLLQGEFDEEGQQAAFQAAVAAWRKGAGGGKGGARGLATIGGSTWSNPFAAGTDENSESGTAGTGTGGALLDGALDEEAERVAFQKALLEWRTGKPSAEKNSSAVPLSSAAVGDSKPIPSPDRTGKAVCYNCFKQFYAAGGFKPEQGENGLSTKPFCSSACWESSRAAGEALTARLQASVTRRLTEDGMGASASAGISAGASPNVSMDSDAGMGYPAAAHDEAAWDGDALAAAAEAAAISAALERVASLEWAGRDTKDEGPAPPPPNTSIWDVAVEDYM